MDITTIGKENGGVRNSRIDITYTCSDSFKKSELKPWLKKRWCIGKITPEYIWRMENILDLYSQKYDPKRPLICIDERPCQLIGEVSKPMKAKRGRVKREDYEYKRKGTCCVFMAFEPLTGWRCIEVKEQRTKVDYAKFLKELADTYYPDVEKIRVVQDNLNTHNESSFYETFSAEEAFRLAKKYEFNYTPKKASWLNMVEIELSVLSKQCLDRRIPTIKKLKKEVVAWERLRNKEQRTVKWKFTKSDARVKLKKFYPNQT